MNTIYKTRKYLIKNQNIRFLSGVSLWDEELTTSIKHKIEMHWKEKIWSPNFNEDDTKREKFYVLSMFPYPSGNLHMGHVRVYTISDTVARFHRMNGKNVLHPIGWDAFGLPAENAAVERNIPPDVWTKQNISQMKRQLKQLGCSFDWDREISTCHPDYYKWTQYLFLKMFQTGLLYQKEELVNWDPVDKTVLAHEQVDVNGFSWRSGAKVEKKLLKQWFIRTTKFAKDLYDGLNDPKLENWRDIIKLQKHWIGECNGVSFDFKIGGIESNNNDILTVWTSKPELLANAEFIAVKFENKLANYEYETVNGVQRLFIHAENPLTGKKIPIFVTDDLNYELFSDTYLGIPNGFEADKIFTKKVNLNITEQINNEYDLHSICAKAKASGFGGYYTSGKLKDWLISRQRFWGTPIPIIYCDSCGTLPVPEDHLPVMLPKNLTDKESWAKVKCPKCEKPAKRETDTMDTFVDSAWYFLRYIDPRNSKEIFSKLKVEKLTPVDLYIGGKEHAVLHLYYARFLSYFLHSLDLIPAKEPFKRLLVQGMIMGQTFKLKETGKYLSKLEVDIIDLKKNKAVEKATGKPVVISWEKMGKSSLNGVDPDEMFEKYGTDTTRLLILADVAPTSHRNWSPATFPGILNWQHRLWLTISNFIKFRKNFPPDCSAEEFQSQEEKLFDSRNFYIKGATFNYYLSQQMSVAISKMQGLTNSLRRAPPGVIAKSGEFERALAAQIILLAPMAPHFASELWIGFQSAPNRINKNTNDFHWDKSVLEQCWPQIDWNYKLDLSCQVNGHENAIVKIPRRDLENMAEETAIKIALNQPEIEKFLETYEIVTIKYKVITGYQGIVNFITKKITMKENQIQNKL